MKPFEEVWRIVRRVPRGKVVTYGQLSRMIAGRLTPVGIGWAIRAAPDGLVPWQRVVNARGGISTDCEHPGLQRAMLEDEGVRFAKDGTIDLARHGWAPREERWFVYVARCADASLYVGIARDVSARIAAHDAGRGAKYTRGRGPLRVLCTRRCADKGEALRLELALKRLPRDEKLALTASPRRFAAFARTVNATRTADRC